MIVRLGIFRFGVLCVCLGTLWPPFAAALRERNGGAREGGMKDGENWGVAEWKIGRGKGSKVTELLMIVGVMR